MRARTRSLRRTLVHLVAAVCVIAAVCAALVYLPPLVFHADKPQRQSYDAICRAQGADGKSYTLSPDQARIASQITQIATGRGLPDRAVTVALATAMQESRLMNLDYGDRDSLGVFQQRPSQGWGSADQVMDVTYAANAFFNVLVTVQGWQSMPVEDAAQAVQRSGYPDLYAQWDGMANAWMAGLTGQRPASISCAFEPATASDPDGFATAVANAFHGVSTDVIATGEQPDATVANGSTNGSESDGGTNDGDNDGASHAGGTTTLRLMPPAQGDDARLRWRIASWAVVHARQYGMTRIAVGQLHWDRESGTWTGKGDATGNEITATFR
ncbi:cobalt transporter [Bifidobacterium jacchi]|uniref:Cobalt transporter n=1 Tax=Bifidobacterium jacchi TaxID=2490545 RepID=A0A5N5RCH6_9BIFI|nr:cobalt transporter [Bifidobacterium jacchi]KAB5604485.1 cobalt transporter [Bifidobacterium jacchi]